MEEYAEEKRYVEEEKPYWLNLTGGTNTSGELRFELENYFPEAHYRRAVDQAFQEKVDDELLPDGGRAQYYRSGEKGLVYHMETENRMIDSSFGSTSRTERDSENLADRHGKEQYTSLVLRKFGKKKIQEATEVLTEQSGLGDSATDGGLRLYKIAEHVDQLRW